MTIRYLIVRSSADSPRMSTYDATVITTVVHDVPQRRQLTLPIKTLLGILIEQSLLSDYILGMQPDNILLKDYREKCSRSLERYMRDGTITEDLLHKEQISKADLQYIKNFVTDRALLSGNQWEEILHTYTGAGSGCTSLSIPFNFACPYSQYKAGYTSDVNDRTDRQFYNPVVLSPVYKKDKESQDICVTFYCRTFTSVEYKATQSFENNKTLGYLSSMNYNGRSWKEYIDIVQSLHVPVGHSYGSETLSSALHKYLLNESCSETADIDKVKYQFLNAFRYVVENNTLQMDPTQDTADELASLFGHLGDPRVGFLTMSNPKVKHQTLWDLQDDLRFLDPLGMARNIMAESSGSTEDEANADVTASDDTDDTTDDSGDDDPTASDDDLFSDADDLAEEGGDGTGESDDSEDSGDESGSSSTTDDSSDTTDELDPQDVNPIIEIIEDESFDEYLERGVLNIRIKQLITNPPQSFNATDLQFLKYWYLQWFPCVSVVTTREILSKVLATKTKSLKK